MASNRPTDRFQLVCLPARPDDRHELTAAYVDLVWTEVLGVSAAAVLRRLGDDRAGDVHAVSLDDIARPLAISTGKAFQALRRLHHHHLIAFRGHAASIATTGQVPAIPDRLLTRLCADTLQRANTHP